MSSDRAVSIACVVALGLSAAGAALAPGPTFGSQPIAPPTSPRRIVSLSLAGDEIALALIDDRSRFLALEHFVDDPEVSNVVAEARAVAGRMPMEAEAILASDPDLVILPPWTDATIEALLAQEGVPVHRIGNPGSIDDVRGQIRALGAALGEGTGAERLIAEMDARLEAVRARASISRRPSVLLWSWSGHASARGTVFAEIVALAGGRDAGTEAGLAGYAPLTIEALLEMDPDALVLERYRADGRARDVVPDPAIDRDPRFRTLRAVRDGRVLAIPSALLLATSHHVAALAEALERALSVEADDT